MDAPLFEHFERIDALNLFFCFRWLLVLFKREFGFADVLRLWECVWAAEFDDAGPEVGVGVGVVEGGGGEEGKTPVVDGAGGGTVVGSTDGSGPTPSPVSAPGGLSNHFQLFVALGILEMNRDMLLRYLENFDEMLQYMNELSQQMDVEQVIVQAESLCLALQSLVTPAPPSSDAASGPTAASASKNGKGSGPGAGAELAIPVISADLVGLVTSRRRG
ncbi:unnamed protein product [Tilletia controversa]|nr:unnamed protein product [Tilletia controversa]